MFDVIILMAGRGSRTNLTYNKVFYPINDIPLYQYSLQAFMDMVECQRIILVVHEDEVELVKHHESSRVLITTGGLTRQDSVSQGMKLVVSDYVLIHDGARPNIKSIDILAVYEAAKLYQASVLATPVVNTIKMCEDDFSVKTLDRTKLWAMQTPQGLKTSAFKEALVKASKDDYQGTDDVELMEKYLQIPARIVKGRDSNIKVTTDIDLQIMTLLMKEGL